MVNRLRVGDQGRVADWPLRFRRRGGEVLTLAVTVERSRATTVGWRPCAGCCAGWSRRAAAGQALPAGHAAAQDDARRRDLEALEDLDVAADLDGTVQVLLDAGVRLLGVDGIGLMLADGQGRLCAAGGSDDAVVAFLRAQGMRSRDRACTPSCWAERPGPLPGRRRAPGRGGRRPRRGRGLATIGLYGGPVGACLLVSVRPKAWTDTEQPRPSPRCWPRCWSGAEAQRRRAVAPAPGPGGGGAGQGRPDGPPGHRRRRRRAPAAAARPALGARWPRSRPASCAASAPVPRRRPRLR